MCKQYTSRAFTAPAPDHAAITLIGAVGQPRVWSLADLRALPQSHLRLTMVCDAHPFPPRGWDTIEWSGVPLVLLLHTADVYAEARSVQVAGLDGALTELALDELNGALLALDADGAPLSRAQGFPARLVVPGQSACAMPRFVQRIHVHARSVPASAKAAPRALFTRLEREAGHIRLEGLAFGEAVMVSRDGGPEVITPVIGSRQGVAGAWSLKWADALAGAEPQFVVRPVLEKTPPLAVSDRPLARRWKPVLHRKNVAP